MMNEQLITPQQRRAAEMCLERNMPFALVGLPGTGLCFVASEPSEDECRNEWDFHNDRWQGFFINFFANDEEYIAGVRDTFDENTVIEHLAGRKESYPPSLIEPPCSESTGRLKYLSMATSIISRLKREGGKTVFSRVIVDTSRRSVIDVAEEYFSRFPDTFRYLCFTQETGIWFGATPETVADYYFNTGELYTMALAGTLPAGDARWDRKNIIEHKFVKDYLIDRLIELGATEIKAAEPEEVVFGKVKHLCTPLKATLKPRGLGGMLYALSPTPAVAGTPRDRAISEIFLCETHSRLCYGGFVGLKSADIMVASANLRCATVRRDDPSDPGQWTYYVFAGGGLTQKSDPADEWTEGQEKTYWLRKSINPEITE